ncbi:zinc finger CCCH domain-containing protein 17 [Heracleum sosnowskyi]|uniref:Zinc finger CCCH domain-containing protein 17 n=1 Tax=Heracleum sosnowskyi TaxID=360622 RepID=A0AAD8MYX0_9APIA|nr:zinc finger CCCH domain-containing protein 17 [Heracleum sosnowskyi]
MLGVSQEKLEKNQESQAGISKSTAEDDALKRNTDCVYFLASPLTCKKGSECEYRHSEAARINPRDCWYWLNGNCMNPKCAFRHPPLDGLLGTQVTAPVGHSLPLTQSVPTPSAQALPVPGKQAVPCIFFQQGYCLKGDLCPFMHAPYSFNDKVSQLAVATPATEFQSYKKTFGGLQKSTQQQKNSQNNIRKPVEIPAQVKSVTETERAPLRNGVATNKTLPVHAGLDDELPRYKPANVHSAGIGQSARSNHSQQVDVLDNQSTLNGKDADEFSRDHSPGFDVLVDGELGESDYYHNEDQFEGTRGRDERILNPRNDYEIDRASDYHLMADGDRDMYNDTHAYDSYDHYGRKERRVSSERILGGSAHLERRGRPIADITVRTDESDLRHHLLKQKRGDNSRSVVSHTRSRENRFDDRIYRPPQRDHMRASESVVSSRLRGRIKIPGRSISPDYRTGSWSERETDRGRNRGRLSPERLQGRLKERMKGRVQENPNNEESKTEEGMIGDEVLEDHKPETYEQAEGYSDYEQADGEDYNLEEGENLDPEDEYYEEEEGEDADDFAKKMGVTYS